MKEKVIEKINFKKVSFCFDILAYVVMVSLMKVLPSVYAGIPFFISKVYFTKGLVDIIGLIVRKKQLKSLNACEDIEDKESIKEYNISYNTVYNKYYENSLKPKIKVKRKYN